MKKIDDVLDGLDDLAENRNASGSTVRLPLSEIEPQEQDRKYFDEKKLKLLAKTIKKHGVVVPIKVRMDDESGKYRIVYGERRFRASIIAGLDTIPASISVGDEDTDENEQWNMLIENVAREDLTMYEKAKAFQRRKEAGHTNIEIAEGVGMAESSLRKYLSILKYPTPVLNLGLDGLINSYKHYSAVKSLYDDDSDSIEDLRKRLVAGETLDKALYEVGFIEEPYSQKPDNGNQNKAEVGSKVSKTGKPANPPIVISPEAACILVQRAKRDPMGKYNPSRAKDLESVLNYIASLEPNNNTSKE